IEEPKEIVEEIIEKPEVIAEEVKEEPKEIVLENPQPETPQEQKNPQPVVSAPQEEKKVDVTTPSAPKTEAPANNNQRVSISVSWDSNGNKAVNQPEKVTVRMKKNDADYKSAELSSANGWKTEFEIDDPMAKYAVEQDPVSGFETTYQADNNSIHITNTAEKEQFLTSVLNLFTPKKEEKLQSSANTVDSSAETAELGDSHEVVEVTVTSGSENNTQETQNTEQNAQQQQTVQSYIDNAPKQSIIVSANWTDNNNSARRRPGKTQVSLYLNNSLYMNATLSADNNWTYTFSNLTPGYSYRVEQSSVADYSTSYWTSGNTVYISNQYTGAQPGSSTTQQNVQQGYNNPQNAVNNQQTQYPNNAVQSTSAPTVNVTPAPAATASPVPTQVPVFSPVPTRTPVTVPTSEPIETENQGSSHAWIWIVLLVVSAGAIAAVLISMNKAKKQREAQEAARERARKRAAEAEIRKAQADISEGVRRTQNAERTAQRARQTQSREAYSGSQYRDSERSRYRDSERSQYRGSDRTQYRDADRSTYRNDAQRREAPRESSRDTEYRPKH
ncbi:MAG: Cna B-type domain-containing protein, partial [Eubacteriales bacterium]|nr:Cna B-type domain-containing protein [Eubacteriales bacterium]